MLFEPDNLESLFHLPDTSAETMFMDQWNTGGPTHGPLSGPLMDNTYCTERNSDHVFTYYLQEIFC